MSKIIEIKGLCSLKDWYEIKGNLTNVSDEFIDAVYVFVSAGIKPKSAIELADHAFDLSVISTMDIKEAAIKLSNVINKFGATPEEAERIMEVARLKGWRRLFPCIFGIKI